VWWPGEPRAGRELHTAGQGCSGHGVRSPAECTELPPRAAGRKGEGPGSRWWEPAGLLEGPRWEGAWSPAAAVAGSGTGRRGIGGPGHRSSLQRGPVTTSWEAGGKEGSEEEEDLWFGEPQFLMRRRRQEEALRSPGMSPRAAGGGGRCQSKDEESSTGAWRGHLFQAELQRTGGCTGDLGRQQP